MLLARPFHSSPSSFRSSSPSHPSTLRPTLAHCAVAVLVLLLHLCAPVAAQPPQCERTFDFTGKDGIPLQSSAPGGDDFTYFSYTVQECATTSCTLTILLTPIDKSAAAQHTSSHYHRTLPACT